ncbi:endonuclease, partial [Psychroserpens sp.]
SVGKWNREHTYPRSRGGFFDIEEDEIADGPDVFVETKADSLRHGNTDAHALRPADGPENSSRNNKHYGDPALGGYNGPMNTAASFCGDVARSVLFMEIRYNGLAVVNGYPENGSGELGDLETLLDWHRNDPPDDYEMNRNNVVYTWQFNRNPFIDQPDLVEFIWGTNVGDVWNQPLSVADFTVDDIQVFPNPTQGRVTINGLRNDATMTVFSIDGRLINTYDLEQASSVDLDLNAGLYILNITSENQSIVKKLIVK